MLGRLLRLQASTAPSSAALSRLRSSSRQTLTATRPPFLLCCCALLTTAAAPLLSRQPQLALSAATSCRREQRSSFFHLQSALHQQQQQPHLGAMDPMPPYLFTRTEVLDNEAKAAEAKGLEMWELMSTAGRSVYDAILRHSGPSSPRHITVLAGKGNNGGDGYVVAANALADGIIVTLAQIGDPASLSGDAATARDKFVEAGGVIVPLTEEFHVPKATDFVVDGIFGTGLSRDIKKGIYTHAIDIGRAAKETYGATIVAIDIPSGLNADTGAIMGAILPADFTVTFIALKRGLFTAKGPDTVGQLFYSGLHVEKEFHRLVPSSVRAVTYAAIKHRFEPFRAVTQHKGKNGKLCVVGGNDGYSGAIRMTAEAALRTGAGLTTVLTHEKSREAVLYGRPELMVRGIAQDAWSSDTAAVFEWCDVVAIGPGLGRDAYAEAAMEAFMALAPPETPGVIDADGLFFLANSTAVIANEPNDDHHATHFIQDVLKKHNNKVLTPHSGEAARMLGISIADVERDRFAAAKQLHEAYGGVILLKGAGTIITDGDEVRVIIGGNPGLGVGGSGDTLTGIIATLIGGGFPPFDAAVCAAATHLQAANIYTREHGERGVLAGDLLPVVRDLVNPTKRDLTPPELMDPQFYSPSSS